MASKKTGPKLVKKTPKGEPSSKPPDAPSEEYERFEDAMRTILSVPKSKVVEESKRKKG